MSGLQTIIDTCSKIEIDRRRVVGQSVSRSLRLRTAERNSGQPFMWTVTPAGVFKYSTNRALIEQIATVDRFSETEVTLSNNTGMNYLVEYQGKMTTGQLSALTITSFVTATITVGGLPSIGDLDRDGVAITSSTVMFAAGDYVQPASSRYPYIVSTEVLRGSTSTVQLTAHRNLISSENITVTGPVKVGTSCSWRMVIVKLPNINVIIKDRFQWTDDFQLMEKII